jgi:hypothetical protein
MLPDMKICFSVIPVTMLPDIKICFAVIPVTIVPDIKICLSSFILGEKIAYIGSLYKRTKSVLHRASEFLLSFRDIFDQSYI